jgi:hypothetical protein
MNGFSLAIVTGNFADLLTYLIEKLRALDPTKLD